MILEQERDNQVINQASIGVPATWSVRINAMPPTKAKLGGAPAPVSKFTQCSPNSTRHLRLSELDRVADAFASGLRPKLSMNFPVCSISQG